MLKVDFSQFPTLRTGRMVLREITLDDSEALFAIRSDPETMKYIGRPMARSVAEMDKYIADFNDGRIKNESITWAITLHGSDELIGTIGFWRMKLEHHRAEIGYTLSRTHWNQGLMTEAIDAVVRYGFDIIRLHSIEGITEPANKGSRRVLERSAFVQEGYFKESFYFEGKYFDSVVYSRLAERTARK